MKLRRQTQSALNFHQVVNTNERILPSSIVEQERSSCLRLKIFKIEYFLGEWEDKLRALSSKEICSK